MEIILSTLNSLEMNELHRAVQQNRLQAVQYLIANGADIADTIDDGQTPLHLACSLGFPHITKELLKNKSRDELRQTINARTVKCGTSTLYLAAMKNSLENARLLLSHGAHIWNDYGKLPGDKSIAELFASVRKVFYVVSNGKVQDILDALSSCAHDDLAAVTYARNSHGRTALQVAMDKFDLSVIGKIIDFRIKLKQDPWQPGVKLDDLMRHSKATRVQLNRLENYCRNNEDLSGGSYFRGVVGMLRESHEFLNAYKQQRDPNLTGQPLLIIIEEILEFFGTWERSSRFIENDRAGMMLWKGMEFSASMLKLCIEAPMRLFMRLAYTSELLYAAEQNDLALVKKCLTGHPNLNEVDAKGRTALRHAFIHRNYEMVKLLLRLGANPAADENQQKKPLLLFALHCMNESWGRVDADILQMMFDRVSEDELHEFVNAKSDGDRVSAFDWAICDSFDINLVRLLMSHGAICYHTPILYNMKKPVALANRSFDQARNGQIKEMMREMETLDVLDLLAVTGVRNDEGKTLIQVVETEGHDEAAKQIRQLLSSERVDCCKRHVAEFFGRGK